MNIILFYLCCVTCLAYCDEPEIKKPARKTINVEQIVVQTIVNQKISAEKQSLHLFGNTLNTHLNNLDSNAFKELFSKLPLRAKIMYMLTVTIDEYEIFLERYTNEEWSDFWHQSSIEEQKHLPKTRPEQLALIRDAYYAYIERHSSMLFPYFYPKAPYPCDIDIFKQQFYTDTNLYKNPNDMTVFENSAKEEYIKAYMLRKRYELFNL